MPRKILSIEVERLPDNDPDTSYLEQDEFQERFEAYKQGAFSHIGIRAKAEIQLTSDLCQTVTSGGLWGIEDDSTENYLKQVGQEEIAVLSQELRTMGFSVRAIRAAH